MKFKDHSTLTGAHAFLSASKYHWLNYDDEKLLTTWTNFMAAQRGTALHDLAKQCIQLGVKLPRSNKTLNMYVNDGIGYKMSPEQVLFYSFNCFGTADTISYRKNVLRISDLKTGVTPVSFHQLEIYAALFFLEYDEKPGSVRTELRIYQNDEVQELFPEPDYIVDVMGKIRYFDNLLESYREEE